MLHIPNSAEENCLTEKENHTLRLKSDTKSANLRMTKIEWLETVPPSTVMIWLLQKTMSQRS